MITCKCGAQCADDAKVCPQCGATLGQMSAKKKPNIIGLVAGALLIICTFLPYVTISFLGLSEDTTLYDSKGVLFLILGVLAIVFSYLGKDIVVLIAGIIACILVFVEVSDISDIVDLGETVEKGIGYYLMIIASIATVAAGPVWKLISKKTNA